MKHITLILAFLLTTFLCFGQNEHLEPAKDFNLYYSYDGANWQNEHLEPAKDFNQYEGDLKEYYDNVFPLLYSGFSEKPYARYTSMPSFSAEYAFSVEKIEKKNYIISNKLSENFWYAGYDKEGKMDSKSRNKIKVSTTKTEINNDLYWKIGELFELLANQTKVYEKDRIVFDGVTYYFATTEKNGEIKTGETWSPDKESLMDRLVKICDNLCSLGTENNIDQTKMIKEITLLINDLKNEVLPATGGLP